MHSHFPFMIIFRKLGNWHIDGNDKQCRSSGFLLLRLKRTHLISIEMCTALNTPTIVCVCGEWIESVCGIADEILAIFSPFVSSHVTEAGGAI